MRKIGVALLGSAILLALGATLSFGANTAPKRANTLRYTLKEMAVVGQTSVESGRVTLVAKNAGTVAHELVVMRGRSPLSVKSFKAVEAGRWLGEVEEIEPGKTGSVTLTLKPGTYQLVCNIVGHYQLGMKTTLTVS